ncbi:MAG: ATP-binding cassette domain-containing protein, partial [Pseudomonadales bacterium]|nr:ATP-binding cassette domain-containing protein [Pseudomonadales bacterium]
NTLSRGQTRRLGLARVLLHDPQVLLLDEPLSGLDPRARIEMRNLLRRLGSMGKTIIVSSHILPELADICNKVGVISQGVLVVNAEVSEVMKRVRERTLLHIEVGEGGEGAAKLLAEHAIVENVEPGDGRLSVTLKQDVEDFTALPKLLTDNGYGIRYFGEEKVDLEAAFMALTKGLGEKI